MSSRITRTILLLLLCHPTLLLARRWSARRKSYGSPNLLIVRGGSTTTITSEEKSKVHSYRLQQQLYLSSRSLQLRQALINRGVDELQHSPPDTVQAVATDWDCALSTKSSPKSCLYSFDAEIGSKVIAPMMNGSTQQHQWITLTALNRLRRNDPTKVEPLWHNQYLILRTWLSPNHAYSLYPHFNAVGTLLAYVLDEPLILACTLAVAIGIFLLLTLPLWEQVVQLLATSSYLWLYWPHWGRFVHAALPLKLLLGQMAFKFVASIFGTLYQQARTRLVEWECQILEDCVPLTILEDGAQRAVPIPQSNMDVEDEHEEEEIEYADEEDNKVDEDEEEDAYDDEEMSEEEE